MGFGGFEPFVATFTGGDARSDGGSSVASDDAAEESGEFANTGKGVAEGALLAFPTCGDRDVVGADSWLRFGDRRSHSCSKVSSSSDPCSLAQNHPHLWVQVGQWRVWGAEKCLERRPGCANTGR